MYTHHNIQLLLLNSIKHLYVHTPEHTTPIAKFDKTLIMHMNYYQGDITVLPLS